MITISASTEMSPCNCQCGRSQLDLPAGKFNGYIDPTRLTVCQRPSNCHGCAEKKEGEKRSELIPSASPDDECTRAALFQRNNAGAINTIGICSKVKNPADREQMIEESTRAICNISRLSVGQG